MYIIHNIEIAKSGNVTPWTNTLKVLQWTTSHDIRNPLLWLKPQVWIFLLSPKVEL